MYAAVMCPSCGRNRIIDLSSSSTLCPYCSVKAETKGVRILYKGNTAREVRDVLNRATGPIEEPKKPKPDFDPMSTLEYNYEKAKGIEKLIVLAEGLTKIKGTFTLRDVEAFEPHKAEMILKKMMDDMMIIEERPGMYRSCQ